MVHEPEDPATSFRCRPAALHILLALADEDRHGYAIIQELSTGRAARGDRARDAVPDIQRLLEQGLVVETRRAPRALDGRRAATLLPADEPGRSVARAELGRLADTLALAKARGVVPAEAGHERLYRALLTFTRPRSATSTARTRCGLPRGPPQGVGRRRRLVLDSHGIDTIGAAARCTPTSAARTCATLAGRWRVRAASRVGHSRHGPGIGANTAVFSLADYALVRPAALRRSERLVNVWQTYRGSGRVEPSPANFRDWQRTAKSFEGLAAYRCFSANMTGAGRTAAPGGGGRHGRPLPAAPREPGTRPRIHGGGRHGRGAGNGRPQRHGLAGSLRRRPVGHRAACHARRCGLRGRGRDAALVHYPNREVMFWTTERFDEGAFEDRTDTHLYVVGRLRRNVSLGQARPRCAGGGRARTGVPEGERARRRQR